MANGTAETATIINYNTMSEKELKKNHERIKKSMIEVGRAAAKIMKDINKRINESFKIKEE